MRLRKTITYETCTFCKDKRGFFLPHKIINEIHDKIYSFALPQNTFSTEYCPKRIGRPLKRSKLNIFCSAGEVDSCPQLPTGWLCHLATDQLQGSGWSLQCGHCIVLLYCATCFALCIVLYALLLARADQLHCNCKAGCSLQSVDGP